MFVTQRVKYLEDYGTIRYYGPLLHKPGYNQTEMWACIEWDLPYRGKHNGTVEGHTYYQSKTGDTSCSLIRSDKLFTGCALSEALNSRYKDLSAESIEEINKLFVLTCKKKKKLIEMVGMDKAIKKIENGYTLRIVALQKFGIREIDKNIISLVPQVMFLYLEQNLLHSWAQFFQLAQLPLLYFISLSNNRLSLPDDKELSELQQKGISKNLKVLVLIEMALSWEIINKLSPCFSNVEELWLCKNQCSQISSKHSINVDYYKSLRLLNVEENEISDWEELSQFSKVLSLEKIILNQNQISSIKYTGGFTNLKSLSLDRCKFADMEKLNELNLMPSLEKFRFSNNSISMSIGDKKCRLITIAKIKKLKVINGSAIRAVERKDYEIGYIKECYEEYSKLQSTEPLENYMSKHHPRWTELTSLHGNPVEMMRQKVDVMKGSMSINSLSFRFHTKSDTQKVITKKIPMTLTVGNLKGLCSKLFGIPSSEISLVCKGNSGTTCLSDNLKMLSFYSLEDDSEVIIDTANNK